MNDTRASYVAYWALVSGKSPSEIYVPRALQPDICYACGWVRGPDVSRSTDGPGNHIKCSRGKW